MGNRQYPAERLLGVIWNHGSGIDDTDVYVRSGPGAIGRGPAVRGSSGERTLVRRALSSRHRRAVFGTTIAQATHDRAIAFDDTSKDFLDNLELKRVLSEVKRQTGRELDVLGFDACLMNMVEVGYQLKGTARVVVGSEELEPGEGWPYDGVLQRSPRIRDARRGAGLPHRRLVRGLLQERERHAVRVRPVAPRRHGGEDRRAREGSHEGHQGRDGTPP